MRNVSVLVLKKEARQALHLSYVNNLFGEYSTILALLKDIFSAQN